MNIKQLLPVSLLLFGTAALHAQDRKLSLEEAIDLAVTKSTEASLADTKVATSKLEVDNVKNNAYPSLKLSGSYLRVTDPTINLKTPLGSSSSSGEEGGAASSTPKINSAMYGMASASVPLFSGFKLKNNIAASENAYKAETFTAANTKEQLAMQAIVLYTNLYKAQQSVTLIEENLKSARQRVKDFTAMEQNGLIARNDLLKSQLQASNVEVSLEDAKKTVSVINYQLVTLLHLPEGTKVAVNDGYFSKNNNAKPAITESEAIAQRNDLEALRFAEKAAESSVKVAKADYYPTIGLSAGYVYLNVPNFVELYNAANVGIGISYDLAGLFKNSKKIKAAESRKQETHQQLDLLTESVKVQVQQSLENYNFAIKQNRVYTEAVTQSAENYRIVKDKYDNGLSDTNDLLEADVAQLQAKLNETFSRADITQRFYELLNASGKLTSSFNLTQNK